MKKRAHIIPSDNLKSRILTLRGQKVILDADLAAICGVSTKRLNEQVKRNAKRFPPDFVFRLTPEEKKEVVANCDHLLELKFSPVLPFAFTENGAVMADTETVPDLSPQATKDRSQNFSPRMITDQVFKTEFSAPCLP